MDATDLAELADGLRRTGGEPESVEVKSGAGGFPTSLRGRLVAFANTEGATTVTGVDEEDDSCLLDLPDPLRHRDDLVELARGSVTPPLSIATDVVDVDGHRMVVADVPRPPDVDRPATSRHEQGIDQRSPPARRRRGSAHVRRGERTRRRDRWVIPHRARTWTAAGGQPPGFGTSACPTPPGAAPSPPRRCQDAGQPAVFT